MASNGESSSSPSGSSNPMVLFIQEVFNLYPEGSSDNNNEYEEILQDIRVLFDGGDMDHEYRPPPTTDWILILKYRDSWFCCVKTCQINGFRTSTPLRFDSCQGPNCTHNRIECGQCHVGPGDALTCFSYECRGRE